MIKPEEAKEYYIVSYTDKRIVKKEVNKYLGNGWQLYGETVIEPREGYTAFHQVLIR